jgi:serine/threonine protein kinase/tetratricopeptide (TPR) repeat protein
MNTSVKPASESSSRIAPQLSAQVMHVLEEYLAQLERGTPPHPEQLLAQHPELAEPLRDYLASLEFLHRAAVKLRSGDQVQETKAAGEVTELGQLGDYRLLREVGRGGMGIVYEADQVSLSRRVALKVLPFAAALDPKQLQRFKNEAQAAAHLHHTNIVPVFGVGCEGGVHFYAMQYIDGQTLAAFVRDLQRPAEPSYAEGTGGPEGGPTRPVAVFSTERSARPAEYFRTVARLGVQAAEALEHAHGLGVLHRDVKPANLLVDVRGNLWVTDFGLAQYQGQAGLTLTGDLVGTLRYMSPEQALGRRGVVDHRSDIYALGVTLYELLTLRPACDGQDRAEVLRQIEHEEPPGPRRLNPSIPVDLETVVLKAMAKEPDGRYATAQELADDLRRFLEDKPIRARRPTLVQRARKWARRHKGVVAATGLLLVLAVAGLVVNNVLIRQEQKRTEAEKVRVEGERMRAEAALAAEATERERAEGNVRLAIQALEKIYVQVAGERLLRTSQIAPKDRQVLQSAREFYEAFAKMNSASPAVRQNTAKAHRRVGEIYSLLGQHGPAEEAYDQAIAGFAKLVDEFPDQPEYRHQLAISHKKLGVLLKQTGHFPEAERAIRHTLALWDKLVAELPKESTYREDLAGAYGNLALLLSTTTRLEEAEQACRRSLILLEKLAADFPDQPAHRRDLGRSYLNLGLVLRTAGREQEGEQAYRHAVDLYEQVAPHFLNEPDYRRELATSHSNLANALRRSGQHAEADRAYRQCLIHREKLVSDFPNVPEDRRALAILHFNLGIGDTVAGRLAEAEQAYAKALSVWQKLAADFPGVPQYQADVAHCRIHQAAVLRMARRVAEAQRALRSALEVLEKLTTDRPEVTGYRFDLARSYQELGLVLTESGRFQEAEGAYRRALHHQEGLTATLPDVADFWQVLATIHDSLGKLLQSLGRRQEATDAFRRAADGYGRMLERDPDTPHSSLAWFLANCADPQFRDANRAVELAKKLVEHDPHNASSWSILGVAHYRAGGWKASVEALEKAMGFRNGGDGSDWFFLARPTGSWGRRTKPGNGTTGPCGGRTRTSRRMKTSAASAPKQRPSWASRVRQRRKGSRKRNRGARMGRPRSRALSRAV